jgi:hypothetical protein
VIKSQQFSDLLSYPFANSSGNDSQPCATASTAIAFTHAAGRASAVPGFEKTSCKSANTEGSSRCNTSTTSPCFVFVYTARGRCCLALLCFCEVVKQLVVCYLRLQAMFAVSFAIKSKYRGSEARGDVELKKCPLSMPAPPWADEPRLPVRHYHHL